MFFACLGLLFDSHWSHPSPGLNSNIIRRSSWCEYAAVPGDFRKGNCPWSGFENGGLSVKSDHFNGTKTYIYIIIYLTWFNFMSLSHNIRVTQILWFLILLQSGHLRRYFSPSPRLQPVADDARDDTRGHLVPGYRWYRHPGRCGVDSVDHVYHLYLPWMSGWWLSLPLWKIWVHQLGWWNS